MIYDYFRATGQSVLEFSDLMGMSLRGDNVQGFETTWDEVLLSMKKIPEDGVWGKFKQDEIQRFRTSEVCCGIVHSRYKAKGEEASFSRLKDRYADSWKTKSKTGTSMRGEMTDRLKKLIAREKTKRLLSKALHRTMFEK